MTALILVAVLITGGSGDRKPTDAGARYSPTVYVGMPANQSMAKLNFRARDQRPLTDGEVFTDEVKTVRHGRYTFRLLASRLSGDCRSAAWGERLQADLKRFGCTQVARGAYLSQDGRHAGQFAAFNLDRLDGAQQIIRDLDPRSVGGFVVPLAANGITSFGRGFSAAYTQPYGHYAVVTWVQRNGGGRPDSMNELLDASVAVERADDFVWERLVLAGG